MQINSILGKVINVPKGFNRALCGLSGTHSAETLCCISSPYCFTELPCYFLESYNADKTKVKAPVGAVFTDETI